MYCIPYLSRAIVFLMIVSVSGLSAQGISVDTDLNVFSATGRTHLSRCIQLGCFRSSSDH